MWELNFELVQVEIDFLQKCVLYKKQSTLVVNNLHTTDIEPMPPKYTFYCLIATSAF